MPRPQELLWEGARRSAGWPRRALQNWCQTRAGALSLSIHKHTLLHKNALTHLYLLAETRVSSHRPSQGTLLRWRDHCTPYPSNTCHSKEHWCQALPCRGEALCRILSSTTTCETNKQKPSFPLGCAGDWGQPEPITGHRRSWQEQTARRYCAVQRQDLLWGLDMLLHTFMYNSWMYTPLPKKKKKWPNNGYKIGLHEGMILVKCKWLLKRQSAKEITVWIFHRVFLWGEDLRRQKHRFKRKSSLINFPFQFLFHALSFRLLLQVN